MRKLFKGSPKGTMDKVEKILACVYYVASIVYIALSLLD